MISHCSLLVNHRALAALLAAVCFLCLPAPTAAQQNGPIAPLGPSWYVYPVKAAAAQAAAPAPSSDSALSTFFKNTELSGFVDGYYGYNFNKPGTRKAGVERNFDVQHNSFSLSLAELVLEK